MYVIDKGLNRVERLRQCTFTELGFRERAHLQEWIAKDPAILGEELLVIQKEFAGFSETSERLDLLALDKQGNLVIIENKLDDSGRDVTWQALKYASYCSSLTKDQIRLIFQRYLDSVSPGSTAEEHLSEFFDGTDYEEIVLNQGIAQRVILVAANFRKEVTSTVLWLLNYKLRIQCFKVTPFAMGDQLLLNVEQIIPMEDAEEYIISMAAKTQEDVGTRTETAHRHLVRHEFWTQLLQRAGATTERFRNISPSKQSWLGIGAGISGGAYNFVVSRRYARVELYIGRSREETYRIFDGLHARRNEIEAAFGGALTWEREVGQHGARVKVEIEANLYDREQWARMTEFLLDAMGRLEGATRGPLQEIARQSRTR